MHVRHWTLVRQLGVILLLVCLLSFLASLLVMRSLQDDYLEALYARSVDIMTYHVAAAEQEIGHVQQMAYDIVTMNTIQTECSAYLDAVDAAAGLSVQNRFLDSISTIMGSVLQESPVLSCANLIDDRGNVRVQAARSFLRLDPQEAEILDEKGRSAGGATVLAALDTRPGFLFVVKELREKRNLSMRHVGVIVLCIDIHTLESILPDTSAAYLLEINETQTVFVLGQEMEGMPDQTEIRRRLGDERGYELITNGERTFFAMQIPGKIVSSTVLNAYDNLFLHQRTAFAQYVATLAAASLLAFLLALFLAYRTTGELQRMIAHMKRVHGDEPETIPLIPESTHINRDSQDLTETFNGMAERVNALVDENYRNALWQTKTHLALLQAQINPHFLYNTLNTIYWEAKESGEMQIASMTEALSHLLREAVDVHETLVTVDRELEILRYFVHIEKTRYGSRLQLEFDVSDDVSDLAIPKFSLQVLLENAIQHGADKMLTPCRIRIAIYLQDEVCHCIVENTGPAPEQDLMEKLRTGEKQGEGSGIGLINMEKRAKTLLGEDSLLQVDRDEKRGVTVAHLSFPAMPCPQAETEEVSRHEL